MSGGVVCCTSTSLDMKCSAHLPLVPWLQAERPSPSQTKVKVKVNVQVKVPVPIHGKVRYRAAPVLLRFPSNPRLAPAP
ncbi:hypothetical protein C8035_v004516 [Colletotrichum spinosum]|uniref:Uncharacterized protein n=2 Tax=Colletotrichum orbiculare species complex TaxID=2707354 RepID=A0A4R8RAQ6_COLTR|nr:hypothetical protein C8035_v004516 [Colletotrichum spinosum]TDZ51539.1 hypothetical protein CTRI78_v007613 [Colletotrichum trifolii]